MKRRYFFQLVAGALVAAPVLAHHGWTSFDQDKPLYLSGTLTQVRWQNPHAEATLRVDATTKLPQDLATRTVPAQQQAVDGPGIVKKAQLPANAAGAWEIEFAPLSRMQAWGLSQPPKVGDRIEVIGYALADTDKRVLRTEYLFVGGKVYAFRSSPAN